METSLPPELAGAVATQDAALQHAISLLSSQIRQLVQQSNACVRHLRSAELTLQHVQDQQSSLQQRQMSCTHELERMRDARPAMEEATAQLATQLSEMESKLESRFQESSVRANLQAQQTEAAMKEQLDLLEKKFEYLSRVKMEIKDLGKRIDQQDITLDDMRTGLSLLAKSVGSDEVDRDSEDGATRPTTAEKVMAETVMAEMSMPLDQMSAVQIEPIEVSPPPEPASVEIDEPPSPQPDQTNDQVEPPEEPAPIVQAPVPEPIAVVEPSEPAASETTQETAPPVDPEPLAPPPATIPEEPEPTPVPVPPEPQPIEIPPVVPEPEPAVLSPLTPLADIGEESSAEEEDSERDTKLVDDESTTLAQARERVLSQHKQLEEQVDLFRTPPPPVVPAIKPPPNFQHMQTAPNLLLASYVRSRRQQRSARRQTAQRREMDEAAAEQHNAPPTEITKDDVRRLWQRVFKKIVQLRRLQGIPGTKFSKQQMSMGARVRRLEETTSDLEDMLEMLELGVRTAAQSVQTVTQLIAQNEINTEKKVRAVDESFQHQAQSIIGLEERLEGYEVELRRLRGSSRGGGTTSTQVTAQLNDLATQLSNQSKARDDADQAMRKLLDVQMPAITTKFEAAMHDLDERTKVTIDTLAQQQAALAAAANQTHTRFGQTLEELYRDLLVLTRALVLSSDSTRQRENADGAKKNALLNASIALLQHTAINFQTETRELLEMDETAALATTLSDRVQGFERALLQLRSQADKAQHNSGSTQSTGENENAGPGATNSTTFEQHLVLLCTAHLHTFETLLETPPSSSSSSSAVDTRRDPMANTELAAHVKDVVVQLRSVLFLLHLDLQHRETLDHLQMLDRDQSSTQQALQAHDAALSNVVALDTAVKTMHASLESFADLTVSFAKEEDVKQSIQDVQRTHQELRDQMNARLDSCTLQSTQRDDLLERELTQLEGRVNKKLDKDELLWTQEVLERQLQAIAKASLNQDDLTDLHRLLQGKLDKAHFQQLLQQQRAKLLELGGEGGEGWLRGLLGEGGAGTAPVVATRCLSCNGELPASKPQIKAAVKEEVQEEVGKALARQQQLVHPTLPGPTPTPAALPSFNASSYHSGDTHKQKLLQAAQQQSRLNK